MKKLLLTIFAIAAIVACEKDAYDNDDVTNINVLEQAEEIGASVEGSLSISTVDLILDYLVENTNNLETSKKGDNVSTRKGDDYINVVLFSEGGFTYIGLFDNSNDDVCFNGKTISQYFWDNSAGDGSVLSIEDTSGNVLRTINGDFATLFSDGLNSITQISLTPTSLTINGSENLTAINTATTVGVEHNFVCAEGKYRITDAPFPLNGKLGTIINQTMFKGTARNFAGTLEADVIREIEAEIVNGVDNVNQ